MRNALLFLVLLSGCGSSKSYWDCTCQTLGAHAIKYGSWAVEVCSSEALAANRSAQSECNNASADDCVSCSCIDKFETCE